MSELTGKTPVRHFTDLEVWRRSHALFLSVFKDFENIRGNRPATTIIARQVLRSASSIGANIAEGFAAGTTPEYIRFLHIARRSCAETENWYYKVRDTALCAEKACVERIKECLQIHKMLNGLIGSLGRRKKH